MECLSLNIVWLVQDEIIADKSILSILYQTGMLSNWWDRSYNIDDKTEWWLNIIIPILRQSLASQIATKTAGHLVSLPYFRLLLLYISWIKIRWQYTGRKDQTLHNLQKPFT